MSIGRARIRRSTSRFSATPFDRAKRSTSTGARFFEVDHPATQEDKKQRVIRLLGSLPRNVVYVPVDFERESLRTRLSEAGFRADAPAFFVWEGVSMYLTAEAVDATLDYIARGTASGSSIIFDYVPAGVI